MLFNRHPGLGLIPANQFSMDPAVNAKINPFVQYPQGMTQEMVQPWGALAGLGRRDGCCDERPKSPQCRGCVDDFRTGHMLRLQGLGEETPVFESWGWQNRKPLVIGTVLVIAAAAIAGLASVLR